MTDIIDAIAFFPNEYNKADWNIAAYRVNGLWWPKADYVRTINNYSDVKTPLGGIVIKIDVTPPYLSTISNDRTDDNLYSLPSFIWAGI